MALNFAGTLLKLLIIMYYTYILRSVKNPGAIYIGYTGDLGAKIARADQLGCYKRDTDKIETEKIR